MRTITIIFTLILTATCYSQIIFQKAYGGDKEEMTNCWDVNQGYLVLTPQNEYLIANSSLSYGNGSNDASAQLLKLNSMGDTIFTKYYYNAGNGDVYSKGIAVTRDGNYLLGADLAMGFGLGLIKLNTNSIPLWVRGFTRIESGAPSFMLGDASTPLRDNSYLMSGVYSGSLGAYIAICRVDSMGNMLFGKRYGNTSSKIHSCKQLIDGNIIYTGNYANINTRTLLMKTDINGNVLWAKTYYMNSFQNVAEVKEDSNKNLYVLGYYGDYMPAPGNMKFFLLKTDSMGSPIFAKEYGDTLNQWASDLLLGNNGDIYFAGNHFKATSPVAQNAFTMKADNAGNVVWCNKYDNLTSTGGMIFTANNELAFSGWTDRFGGGLLDTYLCKTNSTGNAGCDISPLTYTSANINYTVSNVTFSVGADLTMTTVPIMVTSGGIISTKCQTLDVTDIQSTGEAGLFAIYPNPAVNDLNISSENYLNGKFRIFDPFGKIINETAVSDLNEIKINVTDLPKGIYFIEFIDKSRRSTSKFIKE
jgi:hypothetical protein